MFRRRLRIPRFRRRVRAERRALLRLQEAHRYLAEGQPALAAAMFEELANHAASREIPNAPQLSLQAGRAWLLAGEVDRGMDRLGRGLQMMVQMGQTGRLPRVARRVLSELRSRGLSEEADVLEGQVREQLPGLSWPQEAATSGAPVTRRLPPKCPYCGGTVVPDSIEWVDQGSALCDYCGSVLQGEG